MPAARLQPGAEVLGPGGDVLRLEGTRRLALPAAAHRRLGLPPPVAIAPGALGFGQPSRPLVLGPATCLRLGGAWVPALLLAGHEGIATLDHGTPLMLLRCAGGAPVLAAGTPVASEGQRPCAPADAIPALLRLAGGPLGPLQAYVDHADRFGLSGWVVDPAAPDRVLPVEAICDGTVLARGLAGNPRPDLAIPGSRLRRHGFALRFARPLPPHRPWLVSVRHPDGPPGPPQLIDALHPDPTRFDIALAGLPNDAAPFLAELVENALRAR